MTEERIKDSPEPIWEIIPLSEYNVPSLPTASAVKTAWQSFKSVFVSGDEDLTPAREEEDLYSLPQAELDRIAPFFDWRYTATALEDSLRDWLTAGVSEIPVKFLVGQPFCGHADIVTLLGQSREALIVSPPPVQQILTANTTWLSAWAGKEKFWILPNLEHCYLRHASGLHLVRQFLQLAVSGHLGKGLIACESWAWAYLQRIFPAVREHPFTLKNFDGRKLQYLLSGGTRTEQNQTIRFFNAISGEEITDSWPDQKKVAFEFVNLAALSRGNVAVALYNWRSRLRLEADTGSPAALKEDQSEQSVKSRLEKHIWVRSSSTDPVLPEKDREEYILLLHALLLHGGLPEDLLSEVLPFSQIHCQGFLLRLAQLGFVQKFGSRWYVTPQAYTTVRILLAKRNYLVDDF